MTIENAHDEDEDLSSLDRGDTLPERDDQGRFAAKDAAKDAAADPADAPADEPAAPAENDEVDAAAPKADEPEDDDPKKQNLPIRLNKALAQRDAERQARVELEQRLKALEAATAPAAEPVDPARKVSEELDALYVQVEEARADGDTKTAAALQRQIDAKNRDIVKLETTTAALAESEKAQQYKMYNRMADHLESVYAELDSTSDDYDPTLAKQLNFHVEAYEKMGMSAPDALRQATVVLFRDDPFAQRKPAVPAAPAAPTARKPNIEKAIATEKKQPPSASDRGVNRDEVKIDVARLTDDEFDSLPESKKRELRGDFA